MLVVCNTAKVRFFKQITTKLQFLFSPCLLFAIQQKYDFSSKSQPYLLRSRNLSVVCNTAKVRFFKQITTMQLQKCCVAQLFAILQKYDFSSKSQHNQNVQTQQRCCLQYCKSTIFQANHNRQVDWCWSRPVVCNTAKVRFFKQITTRLLTFLPFVRCLQYCKSTIFQANHNGINLDVFGTKVVCNTAKVRFFKQITTYSKQVYYSCLLFAILQKYDFSSKSQQWQWLAKGS